jgi:hypothetical protein
MNRLSRVGQNFQSAQLAFAAPDVYESGPQGMADQPRIFTRLTFGEGHLATRVLVAAHGKNRQDGQDGHCDQFCCQLHGCTCREIQTARPSGPGGSEAAVAVILARGPG